MRRIVQAQGEGYAKSRPEELALVAEVAASTGVILDPVCVPPGLPALLPKSPLHGPRLCTDACKPMLALRAPAPTCRRYTGKALHGLVSEMRADPQGWAGRKVLFVHTGGLLGMYDKAGQLAPLVEGAGRAHRLALD